LSDRFLRDCKSLRLRKNLPRHHEQRLRRDNSLWLRRRFDADFEIVKNRIASLPLAMTTKALCACSGCAHAETSASARARTARSRFPSLVDERMERREAPECLRGTLRRTFARGSSACLTRADCESASRDARVTASMGLRSPPRGRCASRRSTWPSFKRLCDALKP
jgi:hypothetical protein